MSAHKVTAVVGGDGKPHRFSRRQWIIMAAGILVVAAVLFGLWLGGVFDKHAPKSSSAGQEIVDKAVYGTVENPDYARATQTLLSQVNKTSDKKKQAGLYSQLAVLEIKQGHTQKALDYQLKAVAADPSLEPSQARTIADEYMTLGDKQNALAYYKKALAYYQSKPDTFSGKTYFVNDLNAKIKDLEQ